MANIFLNKILIPPLFNIVFSYLSDPHKLIRNLLNKQNLKKDDIKIISCAVLITQFNLPTILKFDPELLIYCLQKKILCFLKDEIIFSDVVQDGDIDNIKWLLKNNYKYDYSTGEQLIKLKLITENNGIKPIFHSLGSRWKLKDGRIRRNLIEKRELANIEHRKLYDRKPWELPLLSEIIGFEN